MTMKNLTKIQLADKQEEKKAEEKEAPPVTVPAEKQKALPAEAAGWPWRPSH